MMKIFRMLIICLACISWYYCWSTGFVQAEVVDKIVVILDAELVLLSEVREHASKATARAVANLLEAETLEESTLHYIIERRLLNREVQYLAVPREQESLKALAIRYLVKIYHQQDAQAFSNIIQEFGVTDDELEQEVALYVKGIDYIRRKYRFSKNVEDADVVLKLFENWLNELKTQATIQILL